MTTGVLAGPLRERPTVALYAVRLHFMHYNFARPHQTLSKAAGKPTTPAMAAGVDRHPWSVFQIAELLD